MSHSINPRKDRKYLFYGVFNSWHASCNAIKTNAAGLMRFDGIQCTERERGMKMSQVEVERFLGRLLTDDVFRTRARRSLPAAVCREGFGLTDQEVSLLGTTDF